MSSNPPPEQPTDPRDSLGTSLTTRSPSSRTTLTGRLVLTSIALVAAVSIVVAVVTTLALRSFLLDRLDEQLREPPAALKTSLPDALPVSHRPSCACSSEQRPDSKVPGQGPGTLTGILGRLLPARRDRGRAVRPTANRLRRRPDSSSQPCPIDGSPHSVDLPGVGTYRVLLHEYGRASSS